MKASAIQWVIPLWLISGFAFLIVPLRLGRFGGGDDPSLIASYEVANNTRYLTHTEVWIVRSLGIIFLIVTIALVLQLVQLYRKTKTVKSSSAGAVSNQTTPEK